MVEMIKSVEDDRDVIFMKMVYLFWRLGGFLYLCKQKLTLCEMNRYLLTLVMLWGLCMMSARAQVVETNNGHNWARFAGNTVASMGVAFGGKTVLKALITEERPDRSDNKSFPSGHAAIAFAAARSIDKEFRKESIWIPIAGYAAATALGIERVVSDRHHWYDVAAGAAIGYGAAELTWYLSDKLFGRSSKFSVSTTGQSLDVVYNF